jgi:hypothetical protein
MTNEIPHASSFSCRSVETRIVIHFRLFFFLSSQYFLCTHQSATCNELKSDRAPWIWWQFDYSVQIFRFLRQVTVFRSGRGCAYRFGFTTTVHVKPRTRRDSWWILVVRKLWWSRGDIWAGYVARIQKVSEYVNNFSMKIRIRKASVVISRRGRVNNLPSKLIFRFLMLLQA